MIFRRWWFLLSATIVMSFFSDWLFYGQTLGWSLSIFFAAAFVLVILKGGAFVRSKPAMACGSMLICLLFALAIQPGPLVLLMSLATVSIFAMIVRQGPKVDSVALFFSLMKFVWLSPFRGLLEMRLIARIRRHASFTSNTERLARSFRSWILPVGGSLLFSGLFSLANPIISRELDRWSAMFHRMLFNWRFDPAQWFFWLLSASAVWALLRVRTKNKRRVAGPPPIPMSNGRTALLHRCLLLFNLVFTVQTLLDAFYLFGGFHLPKGMSYAEYAHRGSYPLIITALLAAAFVLIAYRPGPATRETKSVRSLVLLWLAQNVFLTFTAAWRLHLYADVYSLTRLRVGAGIWMLLVALGLAWIGLRITTGQSNRWLVNRTLTTMFIVLYLCCFMNFESKIAWHNARHCREVGGEGYYLDFAYMRSLGPEAIPALRWLRERGVSQKNSEVLHVLSSALNTRMANWRGWTYRTWILWDGGME